MISINTPLEGAEMKKVKNFDVAKAHNSETPQNILPT